MSVLNFKNKKVLVAGLGLHGGGVGSVKFLVKEGALVTVTDLRSEKDLKPSLKKLAKIKPTLSKRKNGIKYVLGKHRLEDFLNTDFILKGPGIKPDFEFIAQARKHGISVINDIAIFLSRCPAKIIGVTGSRGKSTTAFLIWKFLQRRFKRVWLAGNIRQSALEFISKIRAGDWVVLELSSFQLQDLADSNIEIENKPEVAVITNIYKEHLDWHLNFKDYLKAKNNITTFQTRENYLFLNLSDNNLKNVAQKSKAKIVFPKLSKDLQKIIYHNLGKHYISSVALAAGVAELLGVSKKYIREILDDFHGLPGRQEKIRELGGISFINDTTSTMPDSTIACIERFWKLKKKNNKIILIAGGQDKNLDYQKLAKVLLKKAGVLILLPGTATDKIKKELNRLTFKIQNSKFLILNYKSMSDAVKESYGKATAGDYVILSPGAASFGLFLNEFDRGKKFVDAVKKIKSGVFFQHPR